MKTAFICLAAGFLSVISADAKVRLGSMFTDNMVLQQNENVRIFGQADPSSKITVTPSWNNKPYTTTTDRTGEWSLAVPTPEGGYTPYEITVSDGEPVVLKNVLVGEVWLASGQSNMEMPLNGFGGAPIEGGFDEIANARAERDNIRFYRLPGTKSHVPLDTVNAVWKVPSPDTAGAFNATAWYFAKRLNRVLDVPVGIVAAAFGGSRVESWLPREILATYPDVDLDPKAIDSYNPSWECPLLMYNGMFNPIKDYVYKGIIWYQGCSNVGHHDTYADRLATMVRHWREQIGRGDIPFYAVEIAPYHYFGSQSEKAPLLREAQWKAVESLPNAGMISTNDLVEPYEIYNIHPGNKEGVGNRLGDLALNQTYGKKQFPYQSPRYKGYTVKGNEIWVAIDSPFKGICRNHDIRGFEIAGADRVFHPADKVSLHWQTNEIIVSSEAVPEPVAVRYCWHDFQPGTLYGGNYLPCIPFRTDAW